MSAYLGLNQLFALIAMLLAGSLGGYAGFILTRLEPSEVVGEVAQKPNITSRESIFAGIAATFIVPLFLSIAAIGSSDSIIQDVFKPLNDCQTSGGASNNACDKFVPSLMLLVAFCVVVGASYRSFFAGISKRLLDALNTKVETLNKEIDEQGEEPEPRTLDGEQAPPDMEALQENENAVLKALVAKPRTRRSVAGIVNDNQGMQKLDVKDALSSLVQRGIAEKVESRVNPGSVRYRLDLGSFASQVQQRQEDGQYFVKSN